MNVIEEFGLDPERFIWQDLSMCVNIPPQAFFEDAESNDNIKNAAQDICDYCPVKEMCLEEARGSKSYGIWGGEMLVGGKIT